MLGNPAEEFLLEMVLTAVHRLSPRHLVHKDKQRVKVFARVFYRRWWKTRRNERSSLHLFYQLPLFLALALPSPVQHKEAVIKASLLTLSLTFPVLLRYHLPACDIQALLPPSPLHLLVLCVGEVTNLFNPPDGYPSHLRWAST